MKIGDLVYDGWINRYGLIIEVRESVVPYRVFYDDGSVDFAADHDLEII